MFRPVRLIAVAGLSFVALSPSTWEANAALVCKPAVEGTATGQGTLGKGTALAKSLAIANWSAKAIETYGNGYGAYTRARNARVSCNRTLVEAKCVVVARPCKR